MSDLMEDGEGVPMHSPVHSPTLQRAAGVPTADLLRALMTTVWDLSVSVAQPTQHLHAVADLLTRRGPEGGRRPEFHGDPARFDGDGDVKAWLPTLELIFDAKGLNPEECFLNTLHCCRSQR